ncbi:TonB-dependent receptor domain-containing protein [Photobacterium lipolyticum]|uniref:Vitamin B12 transporter BtuB n=1 Tax=Photobacterium lipolyticum TaxID=266810 RepID=A0A2T3MTX1_9GAMM|nr:TonB-dependent receptor [Photobacterium lipolyticum]PSW03363.1 TonB-dependent receptor [Photobacterium lipolyticum]
MKKTLLAVALAPLCLQSYAFAAETSPDEVMVVTANRFSQPAGNVLASLDVVTRQQIELAQAKSLVDVIRYLPGVQIDQNGGRGQKTSVFIRGSESSHTLVLLDGVRINSATAGGFNFSGIPAAVIERVELIRGPRAAVYGADAIGGVINIITVPDDYDTKHQLTAGIGGDGYYQGAWRSVGRINDKTVGQITLNKEYTDGYNIKEGSFADSGNDYGYETRDLVAGLNHQFTDAVSANLNLLYNDGYSQYDSYGALKRADLESYQLSAEGAYSSDLLLSSLRYSKYKNDTNNYTESAPTSNSQFITYRESINWLNTFELADRWMMSAGFDWDNEEVGGTTNYVDNSRVNRAVFVTSTANLANVTLEASARHDDNESYGNHTTWGLALGWQFTEELKAYVSHGTAFKAPTFNDLYYPDSGNPDLQPQESDSTEVGIAGSHRLVSWRLSAYDSKVDNMIIYYPPTWTPENVDAELKGIEFDAQFDTGFISHDLTLGYSDPKDTNGFQLARRARESASWKGTYSADTWGTTLGMRYQGKRYSDPSNLQALPSYVVWEVVANYDVTDSWKLSGRVDNLFDKDYSTATDYKSQGRIWYLETSYQF